MRKGEKLKQGERPYLKDEERPYLKDMDANMEKFQTLIFFGEFLEAMKIFNEHGDDSYMRTALSVLDYSIKETKDLNNRIKCLNKQLKNSRNDLFNLRKERGDTDGTLKMYLETNHVLDEVPVEDYFSN